MWPSFPSRASSGCTSPFVHYLIMRLSCWGRCMRLNIVLQAILLLLFSLTLQAAQLSDIEYITEHFPPYNFQEKGVAKGITVEILLQAAKEVGQNIDRNDIYFRPWARGYNRVLQGPMVMLFAMARTPEREDQFQWVGPILQTRIVLLAKQSSHINIKSAHDISGYSIGVVRDDAGEQLVRAFLQNKNPSTMLQQSAKPQDLINKLAYERIDLLAYEETVARDLIQVLGFLNSDYQVVYVLKETTSYFAFSKDVPQALVERLQLGLNRVKERNNGADYNALVNGGQSN